MTPGVHPRQSLRVSLADSSQNCQRRGDAGWVRHNNRVIQLLNLAQPTPAARRTSLPQACFQVLIVLKAERSRRHG